MWGRPCKWLVKGIIHIFLSKMLNIKDKLNRGASIILRPLSQELPFVVINFVLLTAETWHIIARNSASLVRLQWPAIMDNLTGYLLIGFLLSYLMAAVVVHSPLRLRRALKSLFYGLTVCMFAVEVFLTLCFHTVLSPNLLMVVGETTPGETLEFWDTFGLTAEALFSYLIVLILVLLIVACERRWRPRLFSSRRVWLWGAALILLLLSGSVVSCRIFTVLYNCRVSSELEATQEFSEGDSGMDSFTRLLYSFHALSATANEINLAVATSATVPSSVVTASDSAVVVVVIGESYIKSHSQLYGYHHETTPRMQSERACGLLSVFTDVVSPYNTTSITLKNVLFCNRIARGEHWYESAYFPAVFKRGGYHVNFWNNQRTTSVTGGFSLDSLLYNPRLQAVSYDECNQRSFSYDMELVDDYLRRHGQCRSRELVVLHLMGQHVSPSQRYPHDNANEYFTADSVKRSDRSPSERSYIADYDNATRYNDRVLGRIFDYYRECNAVVIYFSDHGEEAYDFRHQMGRQNDKVKTPEILHAQNDIPFVVWCSPVYARLHPEVVSALRSSVNVPFTSDVLSHMLFHLAGLRSKYYNPDDDPLSPAFKRLKRVVYGTLDYDSICGH